MDFEFTAAGGPPAPLKEFSPKGVLSGIFLGLLPRSTPFMGETRQMTFREMSIPHSKDLVSSRFKLVVITRVRLV